MVASNALSRGVFVVAAKRTPFGTFGGSLKGHSPTDLQVIASNAAIQSAGISPDKINSVCIGNVLAPSAAAAPYAVRDIRFGTKLGSDPKLEDMMWTSLTDQLSGTPMGVTAENLAVKYGITREECDAFSIRSQQTWGVANEKGVFADEIIPVEIKT